eukprot:TRINITY_DN22812_c0_g2_i2.p1 TRINITY_DN22812_c0_g2~~TRINITY_DN22812_c0_g2_i2.p1  ORF type:complete len:774 (+),score=103.51 TRINITY_DN22812_c0_g2_i2:59-2323(+)
MTAQMAVRDDLGVFDEKGMFGGAGTENRDILQLGYHAIDLDNLDLDAILADGQDKRGARSPAPRPRAPLRLGEDSAFKGVARASARHSFAHGPGLVGGCCGERLQFTVTAVSEDGRVCEGGAARVAVHVAGLSLLSKAFPEPRPWIEDNGDGSYLVQFICATPGEYHVNAYIGGVALPMCPVSVQVTTGPPSAYHCEVTGVGTHQCQIGEHTEFTITARDEFGNIVQRGGHRFGVRAIGHAKIHEVADNEDGTYVVCYSVPEFAKGPVKLEVLLDGVPVKGSPLEPEVLRPRVQEHLRGTRSGRALQDADHTRLPAALDDAERIRWLQQSVPHEVPDLPEIPRIDGHGAAVGEDAAARTAWRTADEWRRLKDMRDEMAKAREALVEHQVRLAEAGSAVHKQLLTIKESTRGMQMEQLELGKVEARLQSLRGGILKQHQAFTRDLGGIADVSVSHAALADDYTRGGGDTGGLATPRESPRTSPPASPRGRSPGGITRDTPRKREHLGGSGAGSGPGSVASGMGGRRSPGSPERDVSNTRSPLRMRPPPTRMFEHVEEQSPSSGYPGRPGGVLREPPPPPAPPPAIKNRAGPAPAVASATRAGAHSGHARAGGGATPEELGQANRRLFHAFATRTVAPSSTRAAKTGHRRMCLGLQDYLRLTSAAKLRVSSAELEDAFQRTVLRYGGSATAEGERTLAFEIFVELLVETARKRFQELSDAEATAALFEEHLLPLARQLASQEARVGDGDGAQMKVR